MGDFFLELWKTGGLLGIVSLVLAIVAYLLYLMSKMKDENQKMIRDFASSEAEERKKLQARLDTTETAWQTKEQSWDTERETMKGELERSLNREANVQGKLDSVSKELDAVEQKLKSVQKQVNELIQERELDKIEKKQILDEAAKVQLNFEEAKRELATTNRLKKKLEDERSLLERMLSEYKEAIDDLRQRVKLLEAGLRQKDHDLSKAFGTIATLTSTVRKYTDDTQEIPPFDAIENAGNSDEVITPVLNMELNIEEADNTTIVEPKLVTPVEQSADNNENEDNEPKKGAA